MDNNLLDVHIGTKELESLKQATVKIERVEVRTVGEKGSNIVICHCKHPQREETIELSKVKIENKGKLEVAGLWINFDDEEKIRKNSSLAKFLISKGCANIRALEGQTAETVMEEASGYLVLKGY